MTDFWNAHDFIASGTFRLSREWWRVAAINRTAAMMAANIGALPNVILQTSFSAGKYKTRFENRQP
jgi:hypothetical protein